MRTKFQFAIAALAASVALPAAAIEPSWPDLQASLYGEQMLMHGGDLMTIDAPYRTKDDARTQIAASINIPTGIESVSLILDENPMPVSAVFDFENPVTTFSFDVTMRINGPTPVHVVAKGTDGRLFVSETFVKTSGQGACAAPPGTDPAEALATLGEMDLAVSEAASFSLASLSSKPVASAKSLDIDISHPSHSGMQMDQISLLYIPARFIDTVAVGVDGQNYVEITGSISFSENPHLNLSVPAYARSVEVTLTDTDGAVSTEQTFVSGY